MAAVDAVVPAKAGMTAKFSVTRGCALYSYLFFHSGFRFSTKAFMPSF
jgi:hypothetical protein